MKTTQIQRLGSALPLLVCIGLIIWPPYPLQASQLVLTSARADVGPGDERLLLGFTIDGPGDIVVLCFAALGALPVSPRHDGLIGVPPAQAARAQR